MDGDYPAYDSPNNREAEELTNVEARLSSEFFDWISFVCVIDFRDGHFWWGQEVVEGQILWLG